MLPAHSPRETEGGFAPDSLNRVYTRGQAFVCPSGRVGLVVVHGNVSRACGRRTKRAVNLPGEQQQTRRGPDKKLLKRRARRALHIKSEVLLASH